MLRHKCSRQLSAMIVAAMAISPMQAQTMSFFRQFTTPGFDRAIAVAADASGIYLIGNRPTAAGRPSSASVRGGAGEFEGQLCCLDGDGVSVAGLEVQRHTVCIPRDLASIPTPGKGAETAANGVFVVTGYTGPDVGGGFSLRKYDAAGNVI